MCIPFRRGQLVLLLSIKVLLAVQVLAQKPPPKSLCSLQWEGSRLPWSFWNIPPVSRTHSFALYCPHRMPALEGGMPATSTWGPPGGSQEVGGAGSSPTHLPAPPLWAPVCSPHTHIRLVLLPVEDPQQRRVLVSSEVQCDVVDSCDCRERDRG